MEDPKDCKTLTFVNKTARCGSTLLCQIMSRVPGVRVMSEPCGFLHLHGHFVLGSISMAKYARLLRRYVTMLCKNEKKQKELESCSKIIKIHSSMMRI
jgi:hypothetical protein